jgi:UDP-2,3-diacylglucosamine pyrophosphatase LpxH
MLVFISDLHLIDETAGKHNISVKAFRKFLKEIKVHSDNTKDKDKKVKIVFLGDIFDLLRTEEWFQENEEDRPWGKNTENEKMKKRAMIILDKIEKKNKETLNLFTKIELEKIFKDTHVEIIYIPGNHDRLCWMIDELKEKVIKLLDLNTSNNENFKHYFCDLKYGVYALHGHEFDSFNYAGGSEHNNEDYKVTPIGDLIATEIITKIPSELIKKVELKKLVDEKEKDQLKKNFQEIDNIRPLKATLEWLFFQIKENTNLKKIIQDTIIEVMQGFDNLQYVKEYDKWHPFDTSDAVQYLSMGLQKIKLFSSESLLNVLGYVFKISGSIFEKIGSSNLIYNVVDKNHLDNIRYIIMGHTHVPLQEPLFYFNPENRNKLKAIYFNTGTWRKTYYGYQCEEGICFMGRRNMNYVILYTPEEKPNKKNLPVFETWIGREL